MVAKDHNKNVPSTATFSFIMLKAATINKTKMLFSTSDSVNFNRY